MSYYVIDELVTTSPGPVIRLLPFGRLVKGGVARDITREIAQQFRLPHFRPAVKIGSHDQTSPAAGHITGLEVRDDGLYGQLELTEQGQAVMARGDYRYHSPEVIWGDGFEDPTTGKTIPGPLIVGDALLHMPHLGEAAALYSATIGGEPMTDSITVPVSWLDRLLRREPEPTQQPTPEQHTAASTVDVEQFAAIQAERDQLAARLAEVERARMQSERIQQFSAALAQTPLAGDEDLTTLLSALDDDQAAAIMQRFQALSEQVRVGNLTQPIGAPGQAEVNPTAAFDAAVRRVMAEQTINYAAAVSVVAGEQPDLYRAYSGGA